MWQLEPELAPPAFGVSVQVAGEARNAPAFVFVKVTLPPTASAGPDAVSVTVAVQDAGPPTSMGFGAQETTVEVERSGAPPPPPPPPPPVPPEVAVTLTPPVLDA